MNRNIPCYSFSGFFLSTGNFILPLTLLDFNGRIERNLVALEWLTSGEINTKQFILQRSKDIAFKDIGTIPAQSLTGVNKYNFVDMSPLSGNNFYRIKIIDKDGKFSYSNIVRLNFTGAVAGIRFILIPWHRHSL